MKIKVQIAFYKGEGNLIDKLIRFWTKSKYSHTELVHNGYWYSASPFSRVKKRRVQKFKPKNWEFIELEIEKDRLEDFYYETKGNKYDWFGIFLSQFLPLNFHERNRYFCSEWVADLLGFSKPNKFSPGKLFEKLKEKDK